MIIIPDVHGRTFWKDAVTQREENEVVVFLGDYLDPYMYEHMVVTRGWYPSKEESEKYDKVLLDTVENFKEILEYKKADPKNVILLVGNHDCGYFLGSDICNCRRDRANYNTIQKLFNDNYGLFQLVYTVEVGGRKVIFSHAGIHKEYAERCFGEMINQDNAEDFFNNAYATSNYGIMDSLSQVSRLRGGWGYCGSIVWADVHEWSEKYAEAWKHEEWEAFQVFGHSQQEVEPVIGKNYACLDCRRAFRINDDITFTPITEDKTVFYE